jgi:hypothetical protein
MKKEKQELRQACFDVGLRPFPTPLFLVFFVCLFVCLAALEYCKVQLLAAAISSVCRACVLCVPAVPLGRSLLLLLWWAGVCACICAAAILFAYAGERLRPTHTHTQEKKRQKADDRKTDTTRQKEHKEKAQWGVPRWKREGGVERKEGRVTREGGVGHSTEINCALERTTKEKKKICEVIIAIKTKKIIIEVRHTDREEADEPGIYKVVKSLQSIKEKKEEERRRGGERGVVKCAKQPKTFRKPMKSGAGKKRVGTVKRNDTTFMLNKSLSLLFCCGGCR